MQEVHQSPGGNGLFGITLETTIKVGLVLGLIVWCSIILRPFFMITLWGVIISIAIFPLYHWFTDKLGNRKKLSAALVTIFLLLLILAPMALLADSLFEAVQSIRMSFQTSQSLIPPPPGSIQTWPVIGSTIFGLWQSASSNLAGFAKEHSDQLMTGLSWFLSRLSGAGLGFLMFIVSIIISGVLLVYSEAGGKVAREVAVRLMGTLGRETVHNAEVTIRNVARGILGVAFIQAVLAGLGFLVAGVPGAGLWALLCFILAIIQIGPTPVIILVLIYAFVKFSTLTAILLLIWCIPIGLIDNILKPMLLGKGAPAPMLIIFLGAIGGFISFGIIGLFVGAVILSLGYELFLLWLRKN